MALVSSQRATFPVSPGAQIRLTIAGGDLKTPSDQQAALIQIQGRQS